jgi:hypothetical protein
MTRQSLSIGIPTHFRSTDLARLVEGLRRAAPDLAVTVIDDGPDAATESVLAAHVPPVRLIRHDRNQGYAQSLVELFETCETEYLLISADDDLCDAAGLRAARAALDASADPAPADFLATQFHDRGGVLKRGRTAAGPVSLAEIRDASGHAPGLIYRAQAARDALPFLRARLAQGCYAARLYPQVLLVYVMALCGARCRWLPVAPITEGAAHPAHLTDSDGTTYDSPAGRLREQEAFAAAFAAMAEAVPQDARAQLDAVATLHAQGLYRRFMRALRLHHPDLVDTWIPGSLVYCRRSLPRHLLNLWAFRRARRRAEHVLRQEKP